MSGQVSGRDDCCHVSYSGVTLMLSLFPPAEKTIGEWHDELCATKYERYAHTSPPTNTTAYRFFFGRISTQDAAALLSEQGRYLLRCSSVAGAVTISVGLGHSRVKHWRIGRSEKGGFIVIYRTRFGAQVVRDLLTLVYTGNQKQKKPTSSLPYGRHLELYGSLTEWWTRLVHHHIDYECPLMCVIQAGRKYVERSLLP